MMRFKFRSLTTIGLLLSAQTWTPVQGAPVVVRDIAAPSEGGISNNHYRTFDVGTEGMVLNNSVEATNTILAGKISGNSNLGGKPATVILNQVILPPGKASQLLGPLEVGGTTARVIVANPHGIVCNGCRFLNASSVMLTTGKAKLNAKLRATGIEVTSGMLTIEGQGLNDEQTPRVDLVAYSLNLDHATIRANDLKIVGGASTTEDLIESKFTSGPIARKAPLPKLTLGGSIFVKEGIRVKVTHAGAGVNIGGDLTTKKGDVLISTTGAVSILPTATVHSAGKTTVKANVLKNEGIVSSSKALAIEAKDSVHIKPNAAMHSVGKMEVRTDSLTIAGGVSSSEGAVSLTSNKMTKIAGKVDALGGSVDLNASALKLKGTVTAARELRLSVLDGSYLKINSKGVVKSGRQLTLHSKGNISVAGRVIAGTTAGTDATADLSVKASVGMNAYDKSSISASGNLALDAGYMYLEGDVSNHKGPLSLTSRGICCIRPTATVKSVGEAKIEARHDLQIAGIVSSSQGPVSLSGTRDVMIDGEVNAFNGSVNLKADRNLTVSKYAEVMAEKALVMQASKKQLIEGTVFSSREVSLNVGNEFALKGLVEIGPESKQQIRNLQLMPGSKVKIDHNGLPTSPVWGLDTLTSVW